MMHGTININIKYKVMSSLKKKCRLAVGPTEHAAQWGCLLEVNLHGVWLTSSAECKNE